jgi:hypothetical protein
MFFSIIAIVLILMNTYFLTESRNLIFNSKQAFIQKQAAFIATNLMSPDDLTVENVLLIMKSLDVTGLYVTIIDVDGQALYYSNNGADSGDSVYTSEYVSKSMDGNDVFYSQFSAAPSQAAHIPPS